MKTLIVPPEPQLLKIYKQPGETIAALQLDFAGGLTPGESLTAVGTDDAETGLVAATALSGASAILTLAGGENGAQIPVTVTITGSAGSVRRAVLLVIVQDPRALVSPIVIPPQAVTADVVAAAVASHVADMFHLSPEDIAAAISAGLAGHTEEVDPHPGYTTPAEAAAVAPVQSVAGRSGAVTLAQADIDGLTAADSPVWARVRVTPEGGIAVKLRNGTGAPSVKGVSVAASPTTDGACVTQTSEYDVIGFLYENGVLDGNECWVVVAGVAEALLKDNTAVTRGQLMIASATDGRCEPIAAPPPPPSTDTHFKEVGHAIESKAGGVNVLAKIVCHFN